MAKCSRPSARSRHSRPARRCNDRAQMIGRYDWAGGTEAMLRFGPDTGPVVVLALPLFEEANRTRAFAVTMLRALAERGVASVLPDLPGQGRSEEHTSELQSLMRITYAVFCLKKTNRRLRTKQS